MRNFTVKGSSSSLVRQQQPCGLGSASDPGDPGSIPDDAVLLTIPYMALNISLVLL